MAQARIQKRLAALLVINVVGYSRLTEQDETGAVARLGSLRAEVFDPTTVRFDGRIFKNPGDGALGKRNADLPEYRRTVLRIGEAEVAQWPECSDIDLACESLLPFVCCPVQPILGLRTRDDGSHPETGFSR